MGPLPPRELLEQLHRGLMAYSHNRLQDDTAALTVWLLADEPTTPPPPTGEAGGGGEPS
ncbi:hypothetical protein ACWC2T_37545 [Streptomyces sp. NPDC001393]